LLADRLPKEGDTREILTSLEDVQAATLRVASATKRLMTIYTPDLEPVVYDQPKFLDTVKRLVLASGYAKVRVLLADPARAMYESSRFIALARRITSYIEVRHLHPRYREQQSAFLIGDDRAILYRQHSKRWDGIYHPGDPGIARPYLDYFNEAWDASDPDAETRQRHL
jgi:hypothetical protein